MARYELSYLALKVCGYASFGAAGLRVLDVPVPLSLLTAVGVLCLAVSKFLGAPREAQDSALRLPEASGGLKRLLDRWLPTITALIRQADAGLAAHGRFEAEVGGGSLRAFYHWLLSGLGAAMRWVPIALLAMLAGAVVVSPVKLVSGGLGLAGTETGQWLLRQSWPELVARVTAIEVLGQVYVLAGFVGFKALFRRLGFKGQDPELAAAAVAGACYLSCVMLSGMALMQAAPLLGIQLALVYAYCRAGTILVPAAANVVMGLASLYSARMVVLLTADLGSLDALPGIPGFRGVLAVLALSAGLWTALAAWRFYPEAGWGFVRAGACGQWQGLRSLGHWWSELSEHPKPLLALAPAGMLWGIGVYLSSYLTYYGIYGLFPQDETVPPMLKQVLLMPLDMLVYIFLIGAGLEELIFRKGLFKALFDAAESSGRCRRLWLAAIVSSVIFSGFHFIDFSVVLDFFGMDVSRLIRSLMMVYGFTWAGFAARVAAGVLLVLLYDRAGILLIPIIAHFTSNLLEAVGLRWGLPWFLAAVAGIFALQVADFINAWRRVPPSA
ncbi:MAG: CPBP family intramembrane glutamic endopeptidase [Elusimicrobiota bacterium]